MCGVSGCTMEFRQAWKLSLHRKTHPDYVPKKYNYTHSKDKRHETMRVIDLKLERNDYNPTQKKIPTMTSLDVALKLLNSETLEKKLNFESTKKELVDDIPKLEIGTIPLIEFFSKLHNTSSYEANIRPVLPYPNIPTL